MKVRALLYHDVVTEELALTGSGFAGADADAYKFDVSEFERHLEQIAHAAERLNLPVITIGEAISESRNKALLLTFDDGGCSALTIVAPLLESRGWRGHFFIATNFVGKAGFLDEEQIKELDRRGHVIGSHSCSHPLRIADFADEDLLSEWRDSIARLAVILGRPVEVASVPGGLYSSRVGKAAAAIGIRVLFTSEPRQRLLRIAGCVLVGRFSLMRSDSPLIAYRVAYGARSLLLRKWVYWNLKKLFKKLAGAQYSRIRGWYFKEQSSR